MRTWLMFGTLFALCAMAADKSLPNQAGNSKLGLSATVITDRKAITDLMGIDLGEGFILVKIKATPQTLAPLRISMDDFTLVSRKNGEKSGALAPSAIAGSGTMIVLDAQSQGGQTVGARNSPVYFPTGGPNGPTGPPPTGGIGNSGHIEGGTAEVRTERRREADPRLPFLEAKAFPDQETLKPVEGLLYFSLEGKLKPQNLGLIYAGPAGRLVIDFK